MDSWLSIAGSVTSIGAAIWAVAQARSASKAASRAKLLRDEIVARRELSEGSKVHSEVTRILKVASQVGPSCSKVSLRGTKADVIARQIEEFSRFLNEHNGLFSEELNTKAKALCQILEPLIEGLSEAKEFEDIKLNGKQIYAEINRFLPDVKQWLDARQTNVQENSR